MSENDWIKYRLLLNSFIEVLDSIPFEKPTKSNRKTFNIPYSTILKVLASHSPTDSKSNELLILIESAFKTNDRKIVETTRINLIKYLKSDYILSKLEDALKESIDDYDDRLTRVLDFFEKAHSNKRKHQSTHKTISNNNDFNKKYKKLLESNEVNLKITRPTQIQCKIKLKSSEWKCLDQLIQNSDNAITMLSSIIYNSDFDCQCYFGFTKTQIISLNLYFELQFDKIHILHDKQIITYLSSCFKMSNIIDINSYTLESFVRRYFKKIKLLPIEIQRKIFPIRGELTQRHICKMIRDSKKWKNALEIVDPTMDNEFFNQCFSTSDLNDLANFAFIFQMDKLSLHIARTILLGNSSHNTFVKMFISEKQHASLSMYQCNNVDSIVNMFKVLSKLYNIHLVVLCLSTNQLYDASDSDIISNYTIFVVVDKFYAIRILKFRDNIAINHPHGWKQWLETMNKWNPEFSEIWEYFSETGEHVPPIKWMDNNMGLCAYGIPFKTQNYKAYIKCMMDSDQTHHNESSTYQYFKSHNIFSIQYEDAFRFVKRQQSSRHKLHSTSQYQNVNIRELLYYLPLNKIHRMICDNARHGIYCNNVSPIFKKICDFDNESMLRWWVVSKRFQNRISGYFTEFGSIYIEDIFDSRIDPLTESCKGYQWDRIKVMNRKNVSTHSLTTNDLVLILASIYMDLNEDSNKFDLSNCYLPVDHNMWIEMSKKDKLSEYFSTKQLCGLITYNGHKVKDHILEMFIKEYFEMYGPFAVFVDQMLDEDITNYIFDLQMYFNKMNDDCGNIGDCFKDLVNLLQCIEENRSIHLSIPIHVWTSFIKSIPKSEKYQQVGKIPKVPCFARLKNGDIGIIQSYSVTNDEWRICINSSQLLGNIGVCYKLKSDTFNVIENDRVLPAQCTVFVSLVECVENLKDYGMNSDHINAKVISKIDDEYYLVEVSGMNTLIRLKKDFHFIWKDSVWIEMETLSSTNIGNVPKNKIYIEDRTYDKGFANRGSKMRTKMYNPIRKDAFLPNESEVLLSDYIIDDENLCKFLDKDDLDSIFSFINYTGLQITHDELYGLYGKIMDRNGGRNKIEYENMLLQSIDNLWNDMVADRLCFNVTNTMMKVGDNVIRMKEEIIKNVYGIEPTQTLH